MLRYVHSRGGVWVWRQAADPAAFAIGTLAPRDNHRWHLERGERVRSQAAPATSPSTFQAAWAKGSNVVLGAGTP